MNLVEVLLFWVVVTEVGEMDMLDEEAVEEMVRMMPTMSKMLDEEEDKMMHVDTLVGEEVEGAVAVMDIDVFSFLVSAMYVCDLVILA